MGGTMRSLFVGVLFSFVFFTILMPGIVGMAMSIEALVGWVSPSVNLGKATSALQYLLFFFTKISAGLPKESAELFLNLFSSFMAGILVINTQGVRSNTNKPAKGKPANEQWHVLFDAILLRRPGMATKIAKVWIVACLMSGFFGYLFFRVADPASGKFIGGQVGLEQIKSGCLAALQHGWTYLIMAVGIETSTAKTAI